MFHNASITIKRRGNPVDTTTGFRKKEEARTVVERVDCTFSQTGGGKRLSGGRQGGTDHMKEVAKPAYGIIFDDYGYDEIRIGDVAIVRQWSNRSVEKEYIVSSAELGAGIAGNKWFLEVDTAKVPITS